MLTSLFIAAPAGVKKTRLVRPGVLLVVGSCWSTASGPLVKLG
jgi:hypothetical protein